MLGVTHAVGIEEEGSELCSGTLSGRDGIGSQDCWRETFGMVAWEKGAVRWLCNWPPEHRLCQFE